LNPRLTTCCCFTGSVLLRIRLPCCDLFFFLLLTTFDQGICKNLLRSRFAGSYNSTFCNTTRTAHKRATVIVKFFLLKKELCLDEDDIARRRRGRRSYHHPCLLSRASRPCGGPSLIPHRPPSPAAAYTFAVPVISMFRFSVI